MLLEKKGWSGLLIEPSPNSLAALKSKHRKAYVFEGALSPTKERKVMRFSGFKLQKDGDLRVVAEPLTSLLRVLGQKTVDFWSLDIEGFEGPVLNSTDFRQVEVGVLLIETNHARDTLVQQVMAREGFKFIGNSFYQARRTEIVEATPDTPWEKLDSVYVNPAYFTARSLPVPGALPEDTYVYDCKAASMRRERRLPAKAGDIHLLNTC